ncbi:MAG: phosphoadenosine phosphosulfate reductase family protein [Solirubrobacteraceae bacterium]
MQLNTIKINSELKDKSPLEIVEWAFSLSEKAIVTTNFRPYEASILYACTKVKPEISVIWCDTGYNLPITYKHAFTLINQLNLNIDLFVPKQTSSYRDALMGIPSVDDPMHKEFTEQVKLEPFNRAMQKHKPEIWFTNLRKGQTSLRDSLDVVSVSAEGVIKVSPFYYYSDEQLDEYLTANNLPNEHKYFDPTKALENRECGLHT